MRCHGYHQDFEPCDLCAAPTLTATLAERLGLISAAEGELLDGNAPEREAPVNRALRRAGVRMGCAARVRPVGHGYKACLKRWQRRQQQLPRGGCTSRHPAGHRFMMAWDVRAMRAGGERCVRGEAT
jgi:hypothetical protein